METSLAEIRGELMARITPILTAVWPSQAPLKAFDLAFTETGIVLNVQYECEAVLDPIALEMIGKDLQQKLKSPGLSLNATLLSARHEKPKSVAKRLK